jgi:hypothetical protein
MNTRNLAYVAVALCAWCGALILTCPPAFGEKIYYPGASFGEPGSGPGQFREPAGVAVNDASPLLEPVAGGDVYVVDKGNKRVEEFTKEGVFLAEFSPPGGFEDPEQIAVDNDLLSGAPGEVYVTDVGHKVIDRFSDAGVYEGQITEGEVCTGEKESVCAMAPFGSLHGIAVDPDGNLWVYQEVKGGPYVDELGDSGGAVLSFSPGVGIENNDHALAVDADENVYLAAYDTSALHEFTPEEYAKSWLKEHGGHFGSKPFGEQGASALAFVPESASQLAGDSLVDRGGSIELLEPIGKKEHEQKQLLVEAFPGESVPKGFGGFSDSSGLAVGVSATVFASEAAAGVVQTFNYVSVPVVKTEPASGVSETGLTLNGSVNPEGEEVKECYFEYGTEAGKYMNSKGEPNRIACGSNEKNPGEGCGQSPNGKNEAVAVCAVLTGLEPAQVRSFHLVVEAGSGIVTRGAGLTVARPTTTGETVSEVGSSSAKVSAVIDGGGLATCYWFEVGTSTSYGGETAKSCIGPGEAEKAKVELTELRANTVYHVRVQAHNDLGAKTGEDLLFTTFPASSAGLPDGRVYEAVSSIGTGDETDVYVPKGMSGVLGESGRHGIVTNLPFQAAARGGTVAYVGDPPASGGDGNDGDGGGNQYVAERSSGGGWVQVDVDPSGYDNKYVALSDDLSVGVIASQDKMAENAPVEAGTGKAYGNLYRRSFGWRTTTAGSLASALSPFEPLVATPPPCPVTEFGGDLSNALVSEPLFGGGNAGTPGVATFSHLLIEADVALPSTPATATPRSCRAGGKLEDDLYDAVAGQLHLVNVLPDGRPRAGATIGVQGLSPNGARSPDTSNGISADGSRIYWSAVEPVAVSSGEVEERPTALYVRENDTEPEGEHGECGEFVACTVRVDQAEAGVSEVGPCATKPDPCEHPYFWTASSDGSKVFFTDENQLTKKSTAEAGEPDLYEYDLEAPAGERLSDLSVPVKPGPGMDADVRGVVGTSEDGSSVYFVADGVLSEGANAEGREPAPGEPNLYVRHGGVTRFVATLSEEDGDLTPGPQANYGDWQADPGHRTAQVAADGQSVVFMSRLPLTGYDNELDRIPLTEVFVYDAATERLTCASCNPSGEPPVAPALPEFAERISEIWGSFLPASDSLASYQPRVISEDGDRVFFDSIEPLVPQDENGFLDVYEWERDGTGSCEQVGGCIFLLSGGQSDDNSYLVDASASGDDVFFVSRAQLVKADHGDDDVLYDARVGGVEPPAEVECSGAGCQGQPAAAPLFATPASATFVGPGNPPFGPPPPVSKPKALTRAQKLAKALVACRKGPKRKRYACTTQARKRYTPVHKAKKASHTPSKPSGR